MNGHHLSKLDAPSSPKNNEEEFFQEDWDLGLGEAKEKEKEHAHEREKANSSPIEWKDSDLVQDVPCSTFPAKLPTLQLTKEKGKERKKKEKKKKKKKKKPPSSSAEKYKMQDLEQDSIAGDALYDFGECSQDDFLNIKEKLNAGAVLKRPPPPKREPSKATGSSVDLVRAKLYQMRKTQEHLNSPRSVQEITPRSNIDDDEFNLEELDAVPGSVRPEPPATPRVVANDHNAVHGGLNVDRLDIAAEASEGTEETAWDDTVKKLEDRLNATKAALNETTSYDEEAKLEKLEESKVVADQECILPLYDMDDIDESSDEEPTKQKTSHIDMTEENHSTESAEQKTDDCTSHDFDGPLGSNIPSALESNISPEQAQATANEIVEFANSQDEDIIDEDIETLSNSGQGDVDEANWDLQENAHETEEVNPYSSKDGPSEDEAKQYRMDLERLRALEEDMISGGKDQAENHLEAPDLAAALDDSIRRSIEKDQANEELGIGIEGSTQNPIQGEEENTDVDSVQGEGKNEDVETTIKEPTADSVYEEEEKIKDSDDSVQEEETENEAETGFEEFTKNSIEYEEKHEEVEPVIEESTRKSIKHMEETVEVNDDCSPLTCESTSLRDFDELHQSLIATETESKLDVVTEAKMSCDFPEDELHDFEQPCTFDEDVPQNVTSANDVPTKCKENNLENVDPCQDEANIDHIDEESKYEMSEARPLDEEFKDDWNFEDELLTKTEEVNDEAKAGDVGNVESKVGVEDGSSKPEDVFSESKLDTRDELHTWDSLEERPLLKLEQVQSSRIDVSRLNQVRSPRNFKDVESFGGACIKGERTALEKLDMKRSPRLGENENPCVLSTIALYGTVDTVVDNAEDGIPDTVVDNAEENTFRNASYRDWTVMYTEEGHRYFYCESTGVSQWEDPNGTEELLDGETWADQWKRRHADYTTNVAETEEHTADACAETEYPSDVHASNEYGAYDDVGTEYAQEQYTSEEQYTSAYTGSSIPINEQYGYETYAPEVDEGFQATGEVSFYAEDTQAEYDYPEEKEYDYSEEDTNTKYIASGHREENTVNHKEYDSRWKASDIGKFENRGLLNSARSTSTVRVPKLDLRSAMPQTSLAVPTSKLGYSTDRTKLGYSTDRTTTYRGEEYPYYSQVQQHSESSYPHGQQYHAYQQPTPYLQQGYGHYPNPVPYHTTMPMAPPTPYYGGHNNAAYAPFMATKTPREMELEEQLWRTTAHANWLQEQAYYSKEAEKAAAARAENTAVTQAQIVKRVREEERRNSVFQMTQSMDITM